MSTEEVTCWPHLKLRCIVQDAYGSLVYPKSWHERTSAQNLFWVLLCKVELLVQMAYLDDWCTVYWLLFSAVTVDWSNIYVLYRGPFTAWYYMAFIVMSTLGLSMMTLRQYWINYSRPDLQHYIIRIAFYMPVYGFISVCT